MRFKHPHPINIIENTTKYILLLVFPLIRGLLFSSGDFYTWLKGAWFDLLIVALIFAMATLRWYCIRYSYDESGIYINSGFLVTERCYLPYRKLTMVYTEYPFYFMPIGVMRIRADTDGGFMHSSDFSITLSKKNANEIFALSQTEFRVEESMKKVYHPQWFYVAILSLITSNTLTGVLFASTFISECGNLLGKEFEDLLVTKLTDMVQMLAFGLPPAAAILGYILLFGWLISFLMTIVRHIKFNVIRQGNSLEIKTGIVIPRSYSIQVSKINLTEIRQSLSTKLLGFFTVFIHCTGYGKQKNELAVLIPAADKHEARRNLKMLLPEIPLVKKEYKPKLRVLSRFLFPPVMIICGVFAFFFLVCLFFPQFRTTALFVGIMVEIPGIWWLFVKLLSFLHTGIGKENGVYTFYYTYAYAFFTTSLPEHKISRVHCRQSFFQKMSDCCDVIILSYSEGKKRLVVPNINIHDANRIFDFPIYNEKKVPASAKRFRRKDK